MNSIADWWPNIEAGCCLAVVAVVIIFIGWHRKK